MGKLHKTYILIVALFMLCTSVACGSAGEHDAVVIAGSTSVQPYVEILVEDYAHTHSEQVIDVQGGGSSAGIQAVQTGTAEIGMSSRSLSESERHLWSIEIAMDGLAIIVSPENPVDNLTLEELRGIYTGDYTSWSAFGGPEAKIHIITREEGSGTRSAFEDMVMDGRRITPKAIVQDSNGAVRQLVSDDPNSIGYISLGLVDVGEKPVSAINVNDVEPTRENVQNGSYKLYRSFLFVATEKPTGNAMQFIEYICSAGGQRVLENEGLIQGSGADLIKDEIEE